MSRFPAAWTDRGSPFRALAGAFLRRFFDNEITGGTQDLTKGFFWLMAFLAAPLALMPVSAMLRYRFILLEWGPEAVRILSRPDKVTVIALGMTAAAAIAAIAWSSLMLDRRDGLILGALPVRGRTVVLAKLSALAIYVFGISAAIHAISSVVFGIVLGDGSHSVRLVVLGPVAHFVAATGACAFVFLGVTALQGVTLALAGPAAFRRVSPLLQIALVAAIVVGLTRIGPLVRGVADFNQAGLVSEPARWLMWAPPVWFLGLYESILGNAEPVYGQLAVSAVLALVSVALLTVVTYASAYHRVIVKVVETAPDAGGTRRLGAIVEWLTRRLSRDPVRRASAQFFFASVARVERLRFVAAVTLGVLCAWLVPGLAALLTAGTPRASPRLAYGLSYAAMALVLAGLRLVIAMPADLKASWIVPAAEPPGRALRSGLWRALFLTGVVPPVFGFGVLLAWVWDWQTALRHAGVMASAGVVLVEVALWHFDDLPSHRPWRPEHANLRLWWPAYVLGFALLTGAVPLLEGMAGTSAAAVAGLAAAFAAVALLVRAAHRRPYPRPSFDIETFVEAPHTLPLH